MAVETLVHATCVALGDTCALLRGPCGAGKSDLALRFLFLPADRLEAGRGRPRCPECDQSETFLDLPIRRIVLDPFELSAPMKLALAMQNFFGEAVD
ncbi:MAG: hypothetical protein HY765_02015 [Rhodomicrobium sp.]|nr:hypothetical protein [Rhodomicrobium sp.]